MYIIADKDILLQYLEVSYNRTRNKDMAALKAAFENESNNIILSKLMLERIENAIDGNSRLMEEFQAFFKEISDDKRITPVLSSGTTEEDDIIEIFQRERLNKYIYCIIFYYQKNYTSISNYCCFWENNQNPNKDWIILNLLAYRTLTVRYNNFNNDAQIKTFFESYFKLDHRTTEVIIIDSYCNLHRHSIFSSLKNGYLIKVYTSSYNRSKFQVSRLRTDIKDYFGSNCTVKFSSNVAILHERTICRNNFILESNHDFAEIKRRNNNWKIDITYSTDVKFLIDEKCSQYN